MPVLKTWTLGCKVNQYETEWVRQALAARGYRAPCEDREPADLCLVNTCTVTAEGDAKSRRAIRRLHRENPDARIVVMGCYAAREPDTLRSLPGVAEVIEDKRELPDWLHRQGVVEIPDGLVAFPGRHRAYVKVQDGCLLRCTYCIIPVVRPHPSSRSPASIEEEVCRLVESGHREIVLTGIHLGHYGVDRNRGRPRAQWWRLAPLLDRLAALPLPFRIRLSSIEATEVTDALLDVMAAHPDRICPHLHICLQSGSDRILRRMRRRWAARTILGRCHTARRRLIRPALTTDVIVGFPGETEADFRRTLEAVEEAGFCKIHRFPFSPRPGTPAASMPDRVPPEVVAERMHRLAECEQRLRRAYLDELLGTPLEVLLEFEEDDTGRGEERSAGRDRGTEKERRRLVGGTACRYVPVRLAGASGSLGSILRVRASGYDASGVLQGVCVDRGKPVGVQV